MTGAVQAATPAAPAAGNATLLSAGGDTPPVTPDGGDNSGNENKPVDPSPGNGDKSPATQPPKEDADPKEGDPPKEGETEPEAYTFTAPEGVTLDPAAVEAFTPVAKDMKLSQEQAQKLVGVYADLQQRQAEAHVAQVAEWAKQVTTDKEIGGAKWPETQALVARARNQFASPELLELMESSGFGNHPAVIKHFALLGKQIADDSYTTGGGQPSQPLDFATEYYARMPKRERVS